MIKERELIDAIHQYENSENPTAQTCIALAAFYAVKNKMYPDKAPDALYSSDTEFGYYARRCSPERLMEVMDELMDTIKVLNPQLYDGVIQRLSDI